MEVYKTKSNDTARWLLLLYKPLCRICQFCQEVGASWNYKLQSLRHHVLSCSLLVSGNDCSLSSNILVHHHLENANSFALDAKIAQSRALTVLSFAITLLRFAQTRVSVKSFCDFSQFLGSSMFTCSPS